MEHFIVYVAVMKVDPVCNLQTLGFCSRHWILNYRLYSVLCKSVWRSLHTCLTLCLNLRKNRDSCYLRTNCWGEYSEIQLGDNMKDDDMGRTCSTDGELILYGKPQGKKSNFETQM